MIFPQDVHKLIQNKGKIAGDNKVQLFVVIFVLGNFFGFFGILLLFNTFIPTAPLGAAIAIHLMVAAMVLVFVFRHFIFDENAKKEEYQGQQADSFTRYMTIRKNNVQELENGVNVFEYVDGSSLFALEFRFGSNDDEKAAGTQKFYKDFMQLVATYGFESRAIVNAENFRTSSEYYHFNDVINRNEDRNMRRIMTVMSDAIFDVSESESNVDKVTFFVHSLYSYQKADVEIMLRALISMLNSSYTAFRAVKFLTFKELIAFYQEFYGIAAIDLAMMKTVSLASDITENFAAYIQVLSLRGSSGKTYVAKKPESLLKIRERKLN